MKLFRMAGGFLVMILAGILTSHAHAHEPYAIAAVSGAVSPQHSEGRFEVFVAVTGSQGGVYHTWQVADGPGWEKVWTVYGPPPDKNRDGLVATRDGAGRVICAWIKGGNIRLAEAVNPNASLLSNDSITVYPTRDADGKTYNFKALVSAVNPDGTVEILALNDRGRIFSLREKSTVADGNAWQWVDGRPQLIGGTDVQQITVTRYGQGLALVALGKDGKAYAKFQSNPGVWDAEPNWTFLDGNKIRRIYAAESSAGQLEVLALGADSSYYLNYQELNSSVWSGWQRTVVGNSAFPLPFAAPAYFNRFKDGTLFFASHLNAGDTQYKGSFGKSFQSPGNGSWSGKWQMYIPWVTNFPRGSSFDDDLGYLDHNVWVAVMDPEGNPHYFAVLNDQKRLAHLADMDGPKYPAKLSNFQSNAIPNLPW